MKELARYFQEFGSRDGTALVLGHPHADPDAVGSMLGLQEILESLGVEVTVGVPSNLSKLAKSVLELIDADDVRIDPPVNSDIAIVVDTSSLDQLEDYKSRLADLEFENLIFIDHHRPDEESEENIEKYYADEEASSSVELVLRLADELDFEFTPEVATLMLTGIISDSGHFKFANRETFESVAYLLGNGADYKEAMDALDVEDDRSKRIAVLKSTQRSELHKAHDRWIVFSEVGAYESDAASFFVRAGADVSLVASFDEEDEKVRISSRSRSGVASETHLHLGELMSDLAEQFDGTGGGHAGAAGLTAFCKLDEIKKEALRGVEKMLRPKEE